MTAHEHPDPSASDSGAEPKPSILRDWVIPVGVGLAIGAGLVWAWNAAGLGSPARIVRGAFMNDVEKIADRWEPFNADVEESLEEEIRALGKDARERVLQAYRGVEVTPTDPWSLLRKLWLGRILARDPYFDTASLLRICRDAEAPVWDRRAAAAVLCDVLGKDVDPTAVVDVLLAWVEDRTLFDHGQPMMRVKTLIHTKVFPPDSKPRMVAALRAIASGKGGPAAPTPDDERLLEGDRFGAILELGGVARNDEPMKRLLWDIALDESETVTARIAAVRAFSENGIFADADKWKLAAEAKAPQVRQAVGENLQHTMDASFDPVLAALHADAFELARSGSVASQVQRKRPTMLPMMDVLVEDHSVAVRIEAVNACGAFKDHDEGTTPSQRTGMLLRIVESAGDADEVSAAVCALKAVTGRAFGFADGDIDDRFGEVRPAALAAFMADPKGRADAVRQWREALPNAVWTAGDRRKAWEKLAKHADPENVARAEALLAGREPPKPAGHGHAHEHEHDEGDDHAHEK